MMLTLNQRHLTTAQQKRNLVREMKKNVGFKGGGGLRGREGGKEGGREGERERGGERRMTCTSP